MGLLATHCRRLHTAPLACPCLQQTRPTATHRQHDLGGVIGGTELYEVSGWLRAARCVGPIPPPRQLCGAMSTPRQLYEAETTPSLLPTSHVPAWPIFNLTLAALDWCPFPYRHEGSPCCVRVYCVPTADRVVPCALHQPPSSL